MREAASEYEAIGSGGECGPSFLPPTIMSFFDYKKYFTFFFRLCCGGENTECVMKTVNCYNF